MKSRIVTWDMFGDMITSLAYQIQNSKYKFDGIYGIPRGGLAIALCLSHRLDLPILLYPTSETLVVDDISDTGETLQNIKCKKIVTLFTSKWTITNPDWFIDIKINKNTWIYFPWENEMDLKQTTLDDFKKKGKTNVKRIIGS